MTTDDMKIKIQELLNECPERKESAAFIDSEVESLRKSFIRKIEEVNDCY